MPWDRRRYPDNWEEMRAAVLARAQDRCEGSPAYPDCRAANHATHPVTGSKVVLTIAHLCEDDRSTQDLSRLRAMSQRCHLNYDLPHHIAHAAATRAHKKAVQGQLSLLTEVPRA